MAFTSYGNKVYASIKDLPQYTSIGNGDKIIIWNESRDGAATIDYADFIIDLEHTSFATTITELINFTSTVNSFISTLSEEFTEIETKVESMEKSLEEEIRERLKTLEFIVAIILGANSAVNNESGIEALQKKFMIDGIQPGTATNVTTKWYEGYMGIVENYISAYVAGQEDNHILSQTKFMYNMPVTAVPPATGGGDAQGVSDIVAAYKTITPTVTSTTTDGNGATTSETTTTIKYE